MGKTALLKSLTTTLRILAKRWLALGAEIKLLDCQLEHLTNDHAPRLRKEFGVGAQTAAVLVCVAGGNPERLRSEAALAALCGVSPLQASSGKTTRHRLNRGGDRAANNALWTIAMVRMRSDPRTQAYVARRTSQGMSRKEIQRRLKRYIVRELYPLILADLGHLSALAETINGLFKAEMIHRRGPWKTRETVELATLEWVSWFNHHRLLEPIGYIPPAEAEANYWHQQAQVSTTTKPAPSAAQLEG